MLRPSRAAAFFAWSLSLPRREDGKGTRPFASSLSLYFYNDTEVMKDASGSTIATTVHSYDGRGRRIQTATYNTAGEVLSSMEWSYNNAGEITDVRMPHLASAFAMGYGSRGQVVSCGSSGNSGGTTVPAYTNVIGAAPTGNESAASEDV